MTSMNTMTMSLSCDEDDVGQDALSLHTNDIQIKRCGEPDPKMFPVQNRMTAV